MRHGRPEVKGSVWPSLWLVLLAACGPAEGSRRPVEDHWPDGNSKCKGEEVLLDGDWVFDGPVTFYREDGLSLQAEGHYEDGLESGRWVEHLADDSRAEGEYRAGLRHGTWTYWHSSGVKQEEGEYVEGKREGLWTWWYSDGQRRSEAQYVAGEFEGPRTDWDAEGRVVEATSGTYRAGVRVED